MKNKLTEIGSHARQGDVLLRKIAKPSKCPKKLGNVPLALGEVTGHHHSFGAGAVCFGETEPEIVELPRPLPLEHQEHGPITFSKGWHERLYQVEDTSQEVRRVMD